jgi:DNA-binding response OmpR family regulator
MNKCVVLVVEDDAAIRRGLCDALTHAGYLTHSCERGTEAVRLAAECGAELVLLDVMLPGMSGFDVLQELRHIRPGVSVIMVTARGAEEDRVRGLCNGADDYVVKPFSARELLARVEAVMRRSAERSDDVTELHFDGRVIDLKRSEVRWIDGEVRQLTQLEAAVIRHLASNSTRSIDRRELLQHVWGLNPRGIQTRTVDMHIARLRSKLERDSSDKPIILTVRGKGYMLADKANGAARDADDSGDVT